MTKWTFRTRLLCVLGIGLLSFFAGFFKVIYDKSVSKPAYDYGYDVGYLKGVEQTRKAYSDAFAREFGSGSKPLIKDTVNGHITRRDSQP